MTRACGPHSGRLGQDLWREAGATCEGHTPRAVLLPRAIRASQTASGWLRLGGPGALACIPNLCGWLWCMQRPCLRGASRGHGAGVRSGLPIPQGRWYPLLKGTCLQMSDKPVGCLPGLLRPSHITPASSLLTFHGSQMLAFTSLFTRIPGSVSQELTSAALTLCPGSVRMTKHIQA